MGVIATCVVTAALKTIAALSNPVGAVAKVIMTVWDFLKFLYGNYTRMVSLIQGFTGALAEFANDAVGSGAQVVFSTLKRAVPVAIDLLVRVSGLGDVASRVRSKIRKFQIRIKEILINLAKKTRSKVAGLFGRLRRAAKSGGDAGEDRSDVQSGLADLNKEQDKYAQNGKITKDSADKVARNVKTRNNVFKVLRVVDGGSDWDYYYEASPGKRVDGKYEKAAFQGTESGGKEPLPVYTTKSNRTPNIAANIGAAQNEGHPHILTRIASRLQIQANRRAALKGLQISDPEKSLDEYPFASTREGGAGARVAEVPRHEQNKQGGDLSSFYQRNGIVEGSKFRVEVDP